MAGRLNWIVAIFAVAVVALLFRHTFATAWSNKCDPDNARFLLLKQDAAVGFAPPGQLFTWENDGPDNSWLCADSNLSVSHVGPQIKSMYDATLADMTQSGWTEIAPRPADNYAVYEKVVDGVTISAVVSKQLFWVEVDLNAPGRHTGEYGFGG